MPGTHEFILICLVAVALLALATAKLRIPYPMVNRLYSPDFEELARAAPQTERDTILHLRHNEAISDQAARQGATIALIFEVTPPNPLQQRIYYAVYKWSGGRCKPAIGF
jgi:hypothetical protein